MNISDFLDCGVLISLSCGRLLVGWGARHWSEKPTENNSPSFYYPHFFQKNQKAWFQHSQWQEISVEELLEQLGDAPEKPSIDWKTGDKEFFFKTFQDLQQKLSSKELLKAVPFSFSSSPSQMTCKILHYNLVHILTYTKNSPLHPYGFWGKEEGLLGGSPELLFSLKGEKERYLTTVAIAGTHPKTSKPSQFLENPKELHEHQLVVEGIQASLKPFGEVKIGEQTILELPTLYHIMTPIEATINRNIDVNDIISALHPTPALGAFPREPGTRWLESMQLLMDRHRFGAPAGVHYQKQHLSLCWVAIRNVQWNHHGMFIGAGCGVVAASQADKEWNEILLKTKATQQMLGFV